jgi:hypothetical protein
LGENWLHFISSWFQIETIFSILVRFSASNESS